MKTSCSSTLGLLACWLLVTTALQPMALSARSLIEAGNATSWRYLDNGTEPAAWQAIDLDDANWKSGPAPLGYGRTNLCTTVGWGADKEHKFITTWFRHTFDRPEVKPGERLVIVFCVDDGAVIYLNGQELGRANMPAGPFTANSTTPAAIGPNDEGFYLRMPVPTQALRPGRNVLAVEVHQCSPKSHDLFFDLALKTMPPDVPTPAIPAAARAAVESYLHQNYIGPDMKIPDGYEDGGHAMQLDAEGRPTSGREILVVDRAHDAELAKFLTFARAPELQALPPLERARRLAVYIDHETTPPGGMRWDEPTCLLLGKDFKNKAVFLGDWIEQAHAGVCRHRALLFKILADEAGLKTALTRGHFVLPNRPINEPHVWNEIFLDDGRRLLVDVAMKRDKQDFPAVTALQVSQKYHRLDNTPLYETAAEKKD
jgi:hypothetical protein